MLLRHLLYVALVATFAQPLLALPVGPGGGEPGKSSGAASRIPTTSSASGANSGVLLPEWEGPPRTPTGTSGQLGAPRKKSSSKLRGMFRAANSETQGGPSPQLPPVPSIFQGDEGTYTATITGGEEVRQEIEERKRAKEMRQNMEKKAMEIKKDRHNAISDPAKLKDLSTMALEKLKKEEELKARTGTP